MAAKRIRGSSVSKPAGKPSPKKPGGLIRKLRKPIPPPVRVAEDERKYVRARERRRERRQIERNLKENPT